MPVIGNRIRHGKPIIRGTRLTVDEVLGALIGGMNYDEIESEYDIEREDILAVIEYTASFVSGEEIRPLGINYMANCSCKCSALTRTSHTQIPVIRNSEYPL